MKQHDVPDNSFTVIIIGGGPAGLFCAVNCAAAGVRVCIIEKNPRPGKKLLITGSGQCNITHSGSIEDFIPHYGGKENFVKPALLGFTNADLIEFFEERGLLMVADENGKYFPETRRSIDVLDVLLNECAGRGVVIRSGEPVNEIVTSGSGFAISTSQHHYNADYVVLATGGTSYPGTGSTGDGYRLARALGHSIVGPAPALVPVAARNYGFAHCAGISLHDCSVSLYREEKKIRQWQGDVLFTHDGLSGPGILDNSRYILPGDRLSLALVAFNSADDFGRDLVARAASQGKKNVKNVIAMYEVPDRVVSAILEMIGIPGDMKFSQLDRAKRNTIAQWFTACPVEIERRGSFAEAMTTSGGVSASEISSRTMESRKSGGSFFAGEIVDVDGDSGGYNLQWAFSSGYLAGRSIARQIEAE